MELQSNTLLQGGKYRIEKVLGQGGFGITYLATQVALGRKVAIKEFFMREYCNRDSETSHVSVPSEGSKEVVLKHKAKFLKEAQTIACLEHEHIIRIHDIFEEHDTAYYVMEYHGCGSLSDKVKLQGKLNEGEALAYIRQIADALKYIHEQNLNHLDVKPGNILLNAKQKVILIDFGLSKRYDEEGNQTSTTPVGISHGYAPLEQYKKGGVGTFSPATDIYSLGATLYKLVTGKTPPEANEVMEDGLPAFPSDVSASIAKAIDSAMQPRKKDRPQSIDEFLGLLEDNALSDIHQRVFIDKNEKGQNTPFNEEETVISSELVIEASESISNVINGHEYVDLGLSVKWATCNIGAEKPEDYGDYFAWGETKPKKNYSESTYEHCVIKFLLYKYSDIGENIAGTMNDTARANWGGSWRLPTKAEYQELVDKCKWTWTTQGGHRGYKVTGPNGNSIFLPAAGFRYKWSLSNAEEYGLYWSSMPDESDTQFAASLYFNDGHHNVGWDYRINGRSVRPVSN